MLKTLILKMLAEKQMILLNWLIIQVETQVQINTHNVVHDHTQSDQRDKQFVSLEKPNWLESWSHDQIIKLQKEDDVVGQLLHLKKERNDPPDKSYILIKQMRNGPLNKFPL